MLDPIEHPIISFIIITIIVLVSLFGFGALMYYIEGVNSPNGYHYIDIDGNEGDAQRCCADAILKCYVDNGYIEVKEFHRND